MINGQRKTSSAHPIEWLELSHDGNCDQAFSSDMLAVAVDTNQGQDISENKDPEDDDVDQHPLGHFRGHRLILVGVVVEIPGNEANLVQDVEKEDGDPSAEQLNGLLEHSNQQAESCNEQQNGEDEADDPGPRDKVGRVDKVVDVKDQQCRSQHEGVECHQETAGFQGAD